MTAAALVFGAALVAAGGAVALVPGRRHAGLVTQSAGSALAAVAGLAVLLSDASAGAPFTSALEPRLGVDALSGLFLAVLGVVACASALFATSYLADDARGRAVAALLSPFVLALALVVCARDPLTFLAGWELMTLLPAAIILVARDGRAARETVFSYVAITHLGGVGTWVAVLLLADAGAFGGGATVAAGSGLQLAIAASALIGMGTKAGLVPLHVWLPRAHPLAPAPVSALMSGVMVKIAVYGLVRVLLEWDGVLPAWFGVVVLALGAASALAGAVYALFQRELKRALAFSTIENVGIIVLALGASLVLRAEGSLEWSALALGAALLHVLGHAVVKALAFLGAGAFEHAAGPLELAGLGGLLRRMPWAGWTFLLAALAMAGLPVLSAFPAEWATLQSLLQVPRTGAFGAGLAGAAALAMLAATVALALFCFVQIAGLALLGPPRRAAVAEAADVTPPQRAGLVLLGAASLVLGLAPGLLFGDLAGLAPFAAPSHASAGLGPAGTGGLPTLALAAALAAGAAALAAARGARRAQPAPTWACGQPLGRELWWSGAGFSKPVRLVLEPVLRPWRAVSVRREGALVAEVAYEGAVPHVFEERLYAGAGRRALALAARARRVQSGSLGVYVGYLVGLVLVLLAAARLGVIG